MDFSQIQHSKVVLLPNQQSVLFAAVKPRLPKS